MSELKLAIERLRQLAKENDELCNKIESGAIKDMPVDKVNQLIRTYRYWYQCCLIAAWLLEEEDNRP